MNDSGLLDMIVDQEERIVSTSVEWAPGKLTVSVRVPQPSRGDAAGWDRARWLVVFDSADGASSLTVRGPHLAGVVHASAAYDRGVSAAVAQTGRAVKHYCETIDWRQQLRDTQGVDGLNGFAAVLDLFPETVDW